MYVGMYVCRYAYMHVPVSLYTGCVKMDVCVDEYIYIYSNIYDLVVFLSRMLWEPETFDCLQ